MHPIDGRFKHSFTQAVDLRSCNDIHATSLSSPSRMFTFKSRPNPHLLHNSPDWQDPWYESTDASYVCHSTNINAIVNSQTYKHCLRLIIAVFPLHIHACNIYIIVIPIMSSPSSSLTTGTTGPGSAKDMTTAHSAPTESKVLAAWASMKSTLRRRPSMPNPWRKSEETSEDPPGSKAQKKTRQQADEEEGLFCDALLGLMQRTGRFDYLDFGEDKKERKDSKGGDGNRSNHAKQRNRFSWSR